jgi:hypothetical protein
MTCLKTFFTLGLNYKPQNTTKCYLKMSLQMLGVQLSGIVLAFQVSARPLINPQASSPEKKMILLAQFLLFAYFGST